MVSALFSIYSNVSDVEMSQFKFYCIVMNDGCLFFPQTDGNY